VGTGDESVERFWKSPEAAGKRKKGFFKQKGGGSRCVHTQLKEVNEKKADIVKRTTVENVKIERGKEEFAKGSYAKGLGKWGIFRGL